MRARFVSIYSISKHNRYSDVSDMPAAWDSVKGNNKDRYLGREKNGGKRPSGLKNALEVRLLTNGTPRIHSLLKIGI